MKTCIVISNNMIRKSSANKHQWMPNRLWKTASTAMCATRTVRGRPTVRRTTWISWGRSTRFLRTNIGKWSWTTSHSELPATNWWPAGKCGSQSLPKGATECGRGEQCGARMCVHRRWTGGRETTDRQQRDNPIHLPMHQWAAGEH